MHYIIYLHWIVVFFTDEGIIKFKNIGQIIILLIFGYNPFCANKKSEDIKLLEMTFYTWV